MNKKRHEKEQKPPTKHEFEALLKKASQPVKLEKKEPDQESK